MSSFERRFRRSQVRPRGRAARPDELTAAVPKVRATIEQMRAENPGMVAMIDQMAAHASEVKQRAEAIAAGNSELDAGDLTGDHAQAVAMGVLVAILRQVEHHCKHIQWPPSLKDVGVKIAVSLAARAAACSSCSHLLEQNFSDSGLCELCERPSDIFTALVLPIGNLVVAVECCPKCSEWMVGR